MRGVFCFRETSAERTETTICPQKEADRGYGVPPERRRVVDNMGRVRRYPHVEGRFASLIYIPSATRFNAFHTLNQKTLCSVSCSDDRKTQIEELSSQVIDRMHSGVDLTFLFRSCS